MNFESFIDQSKTRLNDVEKSMAEFDFNAQNADQKAYENLSREYQRLRQLVEAWNEFQEAEKNLVENRELLEAESDPEFIEVVNADIEELQAKIPRLEKRLKNLILPPDKNDDRNSIVEIRPAAGGDEAGLFAAELHRMYTLLAERMGWKFEVLEITENDVGGIKNVAFSLQGGNVHRYMAFESGVHRVQRVPVTESGGRIHTSTVTVAVLPEAEEVEIDIKPEDLRMDVFRSSGPGGQSVNTTDSAVRITHVPSGLSVASQQEKSQHKNREIAMRILRARLFEAKQAEEAAKNAEARRSQVGTGDRSERIRTYNFPQSRVTDHRYNITRHDLTEILNGGVQELLEDIIAIDVEQRLAEKLDAEF
jgi:peptide chain release factor 1